MKKYIFLLACLLSFGLVSAQFRDSRFSIETAINKDSVKVYDDEKGILKLNPNTSDFRFIFDLASFECGDKKIDSLLAKEEHLFMTFAGNVGKNLSAIVADENKQSFQKVIASVNVDGKNYPCEIFIKFENFVDKSDFNTSMMDMRIEFDPKVVKMPYLSNYYANPLLLQMNDGFINIVSDF